MPNSNPLPPFDGARADDAARRPPIPFTILTRIHPRDRTALSPDAVAWLLRRAGGMWARYGDIPAPLSPAFLERIDPSQPVAVLRAHTERADFGEDGKRDVLVALCSFAPSDPDLPRLIHELVCRPEDYVRVARGTVALPDWTSEEFAHLRELSDAWEAPAPPEALPEGTAGEVRPDGSVTLAG